MKKFLLAFLIATSSMTVVVADAEARRLGGGGSVGRQSQTARQAPSQPAQAPAAKPATPAAAGAPAAKPSMMRNLLGGALLGLGLGMLLSHLGIGGALASIIGTVLTFLLIGLVVMFIYRIFARRNTPANSNQPAFAGSGASVRDITPDIGSKIQDYQPRELQGSTVLGSLGSPAGGAPYGVPSDFDVPGFLRSGKTYFIRLQAAWDRADLNDIREFTSPEMFAEIKMQITERGESPNHTDVMSLDAELLGIETVGSDYLASIKFTGMIKESEHASAEPFAEIWNLAKPTSGAGGWLLAGIQQLS